MRTPMANALRSSATPRCLRRAKTSRAEWPQARMTARAGMCTARPSWVTVTPRTAPRASSSMSVTCVRKRTSPPHERMRATMLVTTSGRTSEPMCGLASQRMSRGEPASTSVRRTRRCRGFLVPVLSLPSENVPAPPSPNWMLDAGSSSPVALKWRTALVRLVASSPCSMRRGARPASARVRAAKSPAHPAPTTMGRSSASGAMAALRGRSNEGSAPSTARTRRASRGGTCSRSRNSSMPGTTSMRALRVKCTFDFLRASIDLRCSSTRDRS